MNDGGEHLLQNLRMHLEDLEEGVGLVAVVGAGRGGPVVALFAAFGELLEKEGDDVVESRATTRRHHRLDRGQTL